MHLILVKRVLNDPRYCFFLAFTGYTYTQTYGHLSPSQRHQLDTRGTPSQAASAQPGGRPRKGKGWLRDYSSVPRLRSP